MNCGEIYGDMIYDRSYSCFEKGCLSNGQTLMGNGGFYGCLSEPQGASAWWKETAQNDSFFSRSLLLNHLLPQCNQAKPNSYYP